MRAEVRQLNSSSTLLQGIALGELAALCGLRDAFQGFHQDVIAPELGSLEAARRVDLTRRMHSFVQDGVDALLTEVSTVGVWAPPVLTLPYPVDQDVFLAGRGLRLVPSFFCLRDPVTFADPSLAPTLVFPIDPATRLLAAEHERGDRLGALLGVTRGAILRAAVDGCTTRSLIRRVGVAPATITHHTTILRDAGMITTRRDGNTATYYITPLGVQLLCQTG